MKRSSPSLITFVTFAYNEERRIEYPIKCFKPYGEVLIIDNYSTDNTVKIAKSLGARVIFNKNMGWGDSEAAARKVYRNTHTDWIFWGSADEMLSKTCLEKFLEIAKENKYKLVAQKEKTLLYDGQCEYLPCDFVIKFFNKNAITFKKNTIHQIGTIKANVSRKHIYYLLPIDEYSIYHFSTFSIQSQLKKISGYAEIHSRQILPHFKPYQVITNTIMVFFIAYFYQGAWRKGVRGFMSALYFVMYTFVVYSRAYELHANISDESMEKSYIKVKRGLLDKSPRTSLLSKFFTSLKHYPVTLVHSFYKIRQAKKQS